MAQYDVRTGMVSHRHPFRGFGANGQSGAATPASITPTPTQPSQPSVTPSVQWGSAALSGGIMGLVTYGVCSGFEVPPNKAMGIGVTVGLMTAIGQIASALLKGWADDVMKTTPPSQAAAPSQTTATPEATAAAAASAAMHGYYPGS